MFKSDKTSIQAFRKSKNGVLFASGSIWEGVDVVGDTLSSIIIVRLPFPIRSATMEEKKIASTDVGTFVMTYAVPEMLIKLRQGAGRLIRSETDTGVISILDTRAARGGAYNRQVRQALEKYPSVDSVEEIREFLKSVKTPEYFNTEEK
jgi:ATP-dependent DNA helicase DinG